MRARLMTLGLTSIALLAHPALGHGGTYRHNYGGDIPPDSRGPIDPPPPSGDALGGPASGPVRAPSGTKATAWTEWPRWWGCNQDAILGLRATQRRVRGSTPAARDDPAAVILVTPDMVRTRIVPTMWKLLERSEESFHVQSASVLGLAKAGDTSAAAKLREMVVNADRSLHKEVAETSALALGLLGDRSPETLDLLAKIVREREGAGFTRPFAAISLGLLGGDGAAETLLEIVARDEPGQDIKPACLLALGALGDSNAVPELVAMVRTGRATSPGADALSDVERSFAVAALGMIGARGQDDEALDAVLEIVRCRHAAPGLDMRRSAAIALGRMAAANNGPRRCVELLGDLADDGGADELERGFALISLGRIAAASADREHLRGDVVAHLTAVLRPARGTRSAFAAISLGLVGRAIDAAGGPAAERDIREPLRLAFAGEPNTRIRGSFALASGLVRDPIAADRLLDVLRDAGNDQRLRGCCALGLGLIGDFRAAETVRKVLGEAPDRDLRIQCATAAGLLGDVGAIEGLVAVLRDPDSSNYELGSAALALGRIGDERAVGALVDIATDTNGRYPDLTRGIAVVALGQLADRGDTPVLARITTDLNYRAHVPAIAELLTIL